MKAQLVPQTYDQLEHWAARVASTDFCPKEYRGKPSDVLICAQYAQEIGLGIIEGLRSIAVINGKPSVYGDGLLALCINSSVCEYVKESPILDGAGNITGYVCEAKRKGQDAKFSRFTIDDAKKAKLWEKRGSGGQDTPWITYPQRMLQMRARGFALRDAFPDVLKGLITREEAQDYPAEAIDMTPATVTAEEAAEITRLIADNNMSFDETANFLKWAEAASIAEISADKYAKVVNTLISRKRRMEDTNGQS